MADKSAVIGLLRVLLSANTAEYEAAMKKAQNSAQAWSKDLKSVGRQASEIGSSLTKAITLPLAGVSVAAAKVAIDFESSFAGVRKTVDGSEADFAAMAQGFRDLAKTIPVNVNDLNRLGEAAGALGIPKDKVVEFAAVMAKLGVSTNLTADQAADAIARIQNIFGAAGKDTERLASTLVALGNAGASTEKEIVEMAQRIAGAGHTVGLSQAQVLAFASSLASVGINAEAGGSAMSRILLKMNDAVQKGGAGLKEFARVAGVSSAEFKKSFETDAAGAAQAFIAGLGRLKGAGENINTTIEGLTGKNIILKDTLFRLSGAGALLSDQLAVANKAWSENSALSKEAGERFKTTESRLILLGNKVKDVGITLGNALRPAIDAAIRGIEAFLPVLDSMAKMFGALPESVQVGIIGFTALVAATGPLIYIFGQLALATSAVTGAFAAKGLASRVLLADLGFLATATKANVVAAAAAVTQYGAFGAASIAATTAVRGFSGALMAMPFAATVAGLALITAGLVHLKSKAAEAALASATAEAKQHAINKAIEQGASKTITYADAVAFNTKKEEERIAAFNRAHRGANTLTEAQAQLTAANAQYAKELGPIKDALAFQIRHMGETGKSVQDLAREFGISELTVTRYQSSLQGSTVAVKDHAGATEKLTQVQKRLLEIQKEIAAAKVPLTAAQEEEILSLSRLGIQHSMIADHLGVSEARVDSFTASIKEQTKAVNEMLDAWSKVPKLSTGGPGITGLDPGRLYDPGNFFGSGTVRNDQLGPIGLDPSTLNIGELMNSQFFGVKKGGLLASLFGSSAEMGQQLAQTIVGAFQGGGNAVQSALGQLGSSVAGKFGAHLAKTGGPFFQSALGEIFTGALPVVGSLIGPLIGAIGKAFSTEGRDTKIAMAKEAFGSVEAMQREMVAVLSKAQYDSLWDQFSRVGQKNKDQAVAAVNAIIDALDVQKKKQEEVAAAAQASAEAQQQALDEIGAKYKTEIDKLENEYRSLSESVAKEAEEEVMGITEMRERERMKQIEDEKAALELQRDAEIAAKKETFEAFPAIAKKVDAELRDIFERGYKIPITFELPPGGIPNPAALSSGYAEGLLSGSHALSSGASAHGQPIHLTNNMIVDGKVAARSLLRYLPGELAIIGVGRR